MAGNLSVITTEDDLHAALQGCIGAAVWGYVRVSSDKQEDGQSPEGQADEIRAYHAQTEALAALKLFVVAETASAGSPMFSVSLPGMRSQGPLTVNEAPRPLLCLLLASLCDRPGSHLVVWKLDRLARVATEQDLFLNLLTRSKVTLHTTYAGERHLLEGLGSDSDDPIRHLMRQILAAFAEYERKLIVIRMQMGTRKKASKGGWTGGNVPYGYTSKSGELVVDPEQSRAVVEIFRLREVHQQSQSNICEALKSAGVPGNWHKMRISRILGNRRLYMGVYDDPYGKPHARPDLVILPSSWAEYDAQQMAASLPQGQPDAS